MQTYRDTFTTLPGETVRACYYDAHHYARTLSRNGLADVASVGIDRARVIYAHRTGGIVTHDWETLHDADPETCAALSLRAEMIREQLAIRAALSWRHRSPRDNRRALDYITRARHMRITLADRGRLRLPG